MRNPLGKGDGAVGDQEGAQGDGKNKRGFGQNWSQGARTVLAVLIGAPPFAEVEPKTRHSR